MKTRMAIFAPSVIILKKYVCLTINEEPLSEEKSTEAGR